MVMGIFERLASRSPICRHTDFLQNYEAHSYICFELTSKSPIEQFFNRKYQETCKCAV